MSGSGLFALAVVLLIGSPVQATVGGSASGLRPKALAVAKTSRVHTEAPTEAETTVVDGDEDDDVPAAKPAAKPAASLAEEASQVKANTSEVTPIVATGEVAAPSVIDHGEVQVTAVDPALSELRMRLRELKQRKTNVVQLQDTLRANAELLRESGSLVRISHGRARSEAERQVRDSEAVVKEMQAMLKQSRASTAAVAKQAVMEAQEVKDAASALSTEAVAQVRLFAGAGWNPPKPRAPPAALLETKAGAAPDAAHNEKDHDQDDVQDQDDDAA